MSYPLTAIISDLHGNEPALETALEDALGRGVQRFVCLGDVIGYGARPRHSLDRVMRLCVDEPQTPSGHPALAPGLCLLGNHEHALLADSAADFNPKARAAIEWTRDEINRGEDREQTYRYWDFLSSLEPMQVDGTAMFAHGSPRDPVREYMLPRDAADERKLRSVFAHMRAGVCFVGHSHVPAVYYEDGRLYRPQSEEATDGPFDLGQLDRIRAIVNVGSVGQPRDGDPRLSYVLFDGCNVTFIRLQYDIQQAMDSIRAVSELPDYLADRLVAGR